MLGAWIPLLLASSGGRINDLWYALPLIASISLVYSATRHEAMEIILPRALRMAFWIVFFLSLFFVALYFIADSL